MRKNEHRHDLRSVPSPQLSVWRVCTACARCTLNGYESQCPPTIKVPTRISVILTRQNAENAHVQKAPIHQKYQQVIVFDQTSVRPPPPARAPPLCCAVLVCSSCGVWTHAGTDHNCIYGTHRSLHDRNRFLLSSFIEKDIVDITNDLMSPKTCSQQKSNRIYTDVACFMESVCTDLKTMYPSTAQDFAFINRLFHRYMTNNDELQAAACDSKSCSP